MKRQIIVKITRSCITAFLCCFMWLIFGPAEIFFANRIEFQFVYQEFGAYMSVIALGITVVATMIGTLLPDKLHRIYISCLSGIAIAGYIQVMFLNKNLDLMGVNPEGYQIKIASAIGNAVIWLILIVGVCVLAFLKYDIWKKLTLYVPVCLLLIQGVAYVSLLISAPKEAYQYPTGEWHISGEDQFVVSNNENVIVIVLDYFSNTYVESLNETYPGATDFLHDFTYYNNADCVYFGTFPSLVHMFTACEVDMSKTVDEWCAESWSNQNTVDFYQNLEELDYVTNIYTPDDNMLCGSQDAVMLRERFSNMSNEAQHRNVNRKLLWKTLFKMSGYRMMPEFAKPLFYANLDEYANVVEVLDNKICHDNYEFYEELQTQGLSVDTKNNYFIVQHLMGPHLWTTDENGNYKENATVDETTKGCMVIVEEYLEQLKELGVYDDATIIITADHGEGYKSQVIFYLKQPGETHDVSPVNTVPISHCDFLPTIAREVGLEYGVWGQAVQDIVPDYPRERTFWLRAYDEEYPTVPCYSGDKDGSTNVYYGYTYTGNLDDLLKQIEVGPDIVAPVADSYF